MMSDILQYLQSLLQTHPIGAFILLHSLGGRRAAIIGARLADFNMFYFLLLAVFLDMLQAPCYFYLYSRGSRRVGWWGRLCQWLRRKEEKWQSSAWGQKILGKKGWGVFLITAMPFRGGGMWTGVFFSHLLASKRKESYLVLFAGSLAGCLLLGGLAEAAYNLFVLLLS